ncbi:MAG: deoxyribose-phosphate aldolase [Bacteroidales bacterium]|nr:deoxyribose-phosphate aldolase [Bacteroidales bacterium]
MNATRIARMIDHSVLHPLFTDEDLKKHCETAAKYHVATVCVKPYHTRQAASLLQHSDVKICAVIGFPHGNSTTGIKVSEAHQVIADGAAEADMVINIGKALQGDWEYTENEIKQINDSCKSHNAILKVIFETDFLTRDADKIRLCKICSKQKVAFVKTSTGYGFVKGNDGKYNYEGATEKDLVLMRKYCDPEVGIKAAGGIRNLDQLLKAHELGATRIGASATDAIMKEAIQRFGWPD